MEKPRSDASIPMQHAGGTNRNSNYYHVPRIDHSQSKRGRETLREFDGRSGLWFIPKVYLSEEWEGGSCISRIRRMSPLIARIHAQRNQDTISGAGGAIKQKLVRERLMCPISLVQYVYMCIRVKPRK